MKKEIDFKFEQKLQEKNNWIKFQQCLQYIIKKKTCYFYN